MLTRSWPLPSLSRHTVGRHDATLHGGVSAHCCHIRRRPLDTEFTHGPHLFRTKQAPVFAQGLASSVAHSCWTPVRKQAVPTAFGTFFEFASSSSKNVAAGRQADRFGGQRQLGTLQKKAASRSGIGLNPRCGHGPTCRHARQWATPNGLESRTEHDARHGGRLR
jgi:hypothetical protein